MSRKTIRRIAGHTFLKADSDPKNWFERARQFFTAANLIKQHSELASSPTYFFNAALSFELIMKAIILAQSKSFNKVHTLNTLLVASGINITKDQELTLELLSEIIIWSGRYPAPKTEEKWDNYYDNILEKHIVRKSIGNTSRVMIHESRFPTEKNISALWVIFENAFISIAP